MRPLANHSCAKSDGSDLLLGIKGDQNGIKRGKALKNMLKTTIFFKRIACFLKGKGQKCDLLSKNEQITHVSVTLFKERFVHGCSLTKSVESYLLTIALF